MENFVNVKCTRSQGIVDVNAISAEFPTDMGYKLLRLLWNAHYGGAIKGHARIVDFSPVVTLSWKPGILLDFV